MDLLLPPNLWLQLGVRDIPFFAQDPQFLPPDDHGYGQKHEEQRHAPERDERVVQAQSCDPWSSGKDKPCCNGIPHEGDADESIAKNLPPGWLAYKFLQLAWLGNDLPLDKSP